MAAGKKAGTKREVKKGKENIANPTPTQKSGAMERLARAQYEIERALIFIQNCSSGQFLVSSVLQPGTFFSWELLLFRLSAASFLSPIDTTIKHITFS